MSQIFIWSLSRAQKCPLLAVPYKPYCVYCTSKRPKTIPRLRDSFSGLEGEFTQPRKLLFCEGFSSTQCAMNFQRDNVSKILLAVPTFFTKSNDRQSLPSATPRPRPASRLIFCLICHLPSSKFPFPPLVFERNKNVMFRPITIFGKNGILANNIGQNAEYWLFRPCLYWPILGKTGISADIYRQAPNIGRTLPSSIPSCSSSSSSQIQKS